MIRFYQVECPKCHGQLNSATPLSGETVCPFCGATFHITANITCEADMPEHIVPFATSVGDFEQAARTMLAGGDYTPEDLSAIIPFGQLRGFYLPVHRYRGSYECAWSCTVKPPDAAAGAETPKEAYRPQNGLSKGDYTLLCLAREGVESGKELAEYVRSLDDAGNRHQAPQPDDLHGYFFLTPNRDHATAWQQWGKDALDGIARQNVLMQLQGSDVKDFKYSVSQEATPEGAPMFFPVWMVHYRYDGQPHHIFMDGTGRTGVKGTTPVDRTLKARAEKPFTILKLIAVAAILTPLALLLAGWVQPAIIALAALGLVFFAYRYYARWHRAKVIRKARKEQK